jgi:hypothetical protein
MPPVLEVLVVPPKATSEDIPFALGGWFDQVGTTQDIVNAVIDFANVVVSPDPEIFVSVYFDAVNDDEKNFALQDEDGEWTSISRSEALLRTKQVIDFERTLAIEMLANAAQGTAQLSRCLTLWVNQGRKSNITMRPRLSFNNDRVKLSWVFQGPNTPSGWIYFAASVIASESPGNETNIARCQLSTCGRFFAVQRKGVGKPATRYCRVEHMREQHRLNSTERTRRARAKKKTEATKGRRRKSK